ncbi:MAG: cytochrome b N-terminal domain-containing protein [Alphaproteobacteria bacterium]|nr:cytochrome b N-terminal domain-containing protein [Alphaproteobacteria bacterium]
MSATQFKSPVVRWIDHRLPVFSMLHHTAHDYPTPKNLNYLWNFGSLAGLSLAIMIVTGIVLAMSYTAHVDYAFDSVERIMRDVNHGWMIRYIHMNTASFFFIVVYLHMFRGLYYGSYKAPRELLWMLGVVIFLLMMATAFMGYVLPWGQMSFWGATVITNLFSAIPYVGESIVTLLWGGFSVDNATLNRFFSLHYLMPFIIAGVVVLHIVALHRFGSNNPIGIDTKGPQDTISFHPYYTIKDGFGLAVLFVLPWLDRSPVRSARFRPLFRIFFWLFFVNAIALGYLGGKPAEGIYVILSRVATAWYFLHFLAILPLLSMFETTKPLPKSISEPVLGSPGRVA